MIIAVNTRILSGDAAARKLLLQVFTAIATANTNHRFYFISENELEPKAALRNVEYVVLKQRSQQPLLWKFWYNYTVPSLLKKIKADVLISADGICSLRTKVPQYLLINDLEFLQHPGWYSKRYIDFIKPALPLSLSKAAQIITFSNYVKDQLAGKYKTAGEKITVLTGNNCTNYPLQEGYNNERIKDKYSNGNEYFLYCGAVHERNNLTNILKAFSQFKKRQKSSMQLVLVTDRIPEKNLFVESLRLYKYRNEVKLLAVTDDAEINSITAAAWCCINLSPLYTDINFLLSSLQCGVPVIAGNAEQAKELLQDAALYASPASADAIAEQMMLVYKDENKRNELIRAGKSLPANNTADNTVQLWQHILTSSQK